MTLLSTQVNGFIIDTLNPTARMLRSTAQKAQQLDDQYFGPVNAMIADYRETVMADYSAYIGEWMAFGGAIATYIWECTADQRTEFLAWAGEVEEKIAQFDWFGFMVGTVLNAFIAAHFAADVLAVVWVVISFLCGTFVNHVSNPYEGSDFAIQMHAHRQELQMHLDATAEAIAESQSRMREIDQSVDLNLDMGSLDTSKGFDLLIVFATVFAETALVGKGQLQPVAVIA